LVLLLLAALGALSACAPTLNWRDVTLDGDGRLQFPCKPEAAERAQALADGRTAAVRLLACDAGGTSWSVMRVEVTDPARLGGTLRGLREQFAQRLQGRERDVRPVRLPGAAPSDEARRLRIDAQAVQAQALFVARGTRVYQVVALVRGEPPAGWSESATEFLDSLRWPG
jgi:hypothetical protein